jgi:hypothetical protein
MPVLGIPDSDIVHAACCKYVTVIVRKFDIVNFAVVTSISKLWLKARAIDPVNVTLTCACEKMSVIVCEG